MSKTKPLSCQRCRARKVKCNFEIPCSNCLKVKTECVPITSDNRKKRPSATHVSRLEKAVQNYANLVEKLNQSTSMEETHRLLEQATIDHVLADGSPDQDLKFITNGETVQETDSLDDRAVYGPTSVYDDNLVIPSVRASNGDHQSIKQMLENPIILECLKLFFKWQYPDHNMFLFRELFLADFFESKPDSIYCLKVLVLSVCSLGSRMSDDDNVYNMSQKYYNEAKSLLLKQLGRPSISSMQSFLLLAFYDICNGFNSSGWILSGMAMRMGFDLGFQLNPEVWFFRSKEILGPLDVAIRSRIYWGCYVADHFISLLLGRPLSLKMSDATIPETQYLPDMVAIEDFAYSSPSADITESRNVSNPLKKMINLINISDNVLNDIFTKSDSDNLHSEDLNLQSRLDQLNEYNVQIRAWKDSLPSDLQWDRESLKTTGDNPTQSGIRYYYYILIICLNRPFMSKKIYSTDKLAPSTICSEAIEDIYGSIQRFKDVHGLRKASVFIVYCSILSLSVILLQTSRRSTDKRLNFFMEVLQGCSKTWKLAEKSHKLIETKLKSRELEEESDVEEPPIDLLPIGHDVNAELLASSSKDDFLGGPPVLMTSDLFNQDWESLFPDSIFNT